MGSRSIDARRPSGQRGSSKVVYAPARDFVYALAPMWRVAGRCDAVAVTARCIIVDDSVRFLEAATSRLGRDGLVVVATATTSHEAIDRVEMLRPEVVLVDISLGAESGFDLADQLAQGPDPPVIVLISTRAEEDYAALITASPAVGFIPKSRLSVEAVRALVGL